MAPTAEPHQVATFHPQTTTTAGLDLAQSLHETNMGTTSQSAQDLLSGSRMLGAFQDQSDIVGPVKRNLYKISSLMHLLPNSL